MKKIYPILALFCLLPFGYLKAQTYTFSNGTQSVTTCSGTGTDGGGNYSNNTNSTITICSGNTQGVTINFTSFNTEQNYDIVTVYDGATTGGTVLATLSGSIGGSTFTSTGTCLTIKFTSDGSVTNSGFTFTISCTPLPSCTDGIQNGSEFGVDCGGCSTCPPCPTNPANASVTASSNVTHLPCGGGSVNLSAVGLTSLPVLSSTFDLGTPGPGWSFIGSGMFTNPCGPGLNGTTHLWFGNASPHPRILTTNSLNIPCGGNVCFDLKFATQGGSGSCEGPDLGNEGVSLLYSTDCGATFIPIVYFCPNGTLMASNPMTTSPSISGGATTFTSWANYCFTLPPGASSSHTILQWKQEATSGAGNDHWGLDEVVINANACAPYYYDWLQIPGAPDAANVTANITNTTTFTVNYTNGTNDTVSAQVTVIVDGVTTPTISTTTEPCLGSNQGSVTMTAVGGTGPYTFHVTGPSSYNNTSSANPTKTLSNLAPGNYSVTITDNAGCAITAAFTINPGPVCCSVTASGTNLSCNSANAPCNGQVTCTPAGGVSPYTYQWYTGASVIPGNIIAGATTQTIGGKCAGTYTVQVTDNTGCVSTATTTITQPAAATMNSTPTSVSCFNGTSGQIASVGAGGTGTFLYHIGAGPNNSTGLFTGLAAGSYTVTGQDANGCPVTNNVTITQPTQLVLSQTSITPASCGNSDGSIQVGTTGGTPGYTYTLSGVNNTTGLYSNLAGGTYTVTVTDSKGCTDVLNNIVVPNQAGPVVSVNSQNPVSCFGGITGSVAVAVVGGTSPYSYSLDGAPGVPGNNFNNLASGNHSIVATDLHGCSSTVNFTIAQPTLLTFTTAVTNLSCNNSCDGQVLANISGGTSPYQVSSDNGLTFTSANPMTNLCAGNYDIVIKDNNGCLANVNLNVTQPTPINVIKSSINATCGFPNAVVNFTVSGGSGSGYQVDFNNLGFSASTHYTGLSSGLYPWTIKDGSGCSVSGFIGVSDDLAPALDGVTTVDILCNPDATGEITALTSGGVGTFLYSISFNGVPLTPPLPENIANGYNWTGLEAGYYAISIVDGNNCLLIADTTLLQPPVINFTSITQDVQCNAGNDGFIQINPTGGVLPFTFSIDNGATTSNNNNFMNVTAGTYQAQIQDANGCILTQPITITEPTLLTVSATSTDPLCNLSCDGTVSITAGGGVTAYMYSIDGGVTYLNTPNYTTACAGSQNIIVKDAHNCLATMSLSLTDPADLTLSATTVNSNCGLSNGQIIVNGAGGTGTLNYNVDGGTPQTAVLFTGQTTGNHTITVTDANSCTETFLTNIAQDGSPAINSITTVAPLCAGDANGSLTITASGGIAPYDYAINGGTAQGTGAFTGLSAGSYNGSVTDQNGCMVQSSVTIVDPTPLTIQSITKVDVLCFGLSTGSIQVTAQGGTPPYAYSFDGGTTFNTSSSDDFIPAGVYNIVVRDANNCEAVGTTTINEPTELLLTNTATTDNTCYNSCDGQITLTVTGGVTPYDYNWSAGIAASTSPSATNVCLGTYNAVITDANACQVSTGSIQINQPPLVTIVGVTTDSVKCFGGSTGEIHINAPNATTFTIQGPVTVTQATGDFTGLAQGAYAITVADANGCQATSSTTIYEPALLTITASPDISVCTDGTVNLSAYAVGGNGTYSFAWSNGVNTQTQDYSPTANITLTVSVTDQYGCAAGPVSTNITVIPKLKIDPIADQFVCPGDSVQVTATAQFGVPDYIFSWRSPIVSDTSIAWLGATTNPSTYTVVVKDFCFHYDSTTVNVFVYPTPPMVLSGTMNGCAPLTTTIDVSPSAIIGSNCLWTFGDGTTSTNCGPATHTYNNPGHYPVTFSFTTTDGCPVDTTFTDSIEVYQLPVADFTFSPTAPTLVESTINFTNTSVGGNTYNWTFDTFGASTQENPKVVFPGDNAQTYTVCLQVIEQQPGGACMDKICKQIIVAEDFSIFVPNAFTPGSGDNYNKVFLPILNGFDEQSYTLYIFDRWGEVLFESHDASVGWDGTYGGKLVQDGTYIWKIHVKFLTSDEKKELTGHVTVLK